MGALFDARRRVADDIVKLLAQLSEDLLNTFLGQGILVAGLAGSQDVKVFQALILDQRLVESGITIDYVDKVTSDARSP